MQSLLHLNYYTETRYAHHWSFTTYYLIWNMELLTRLFRCLDCLNVSHLILPLPKGIHHLALPNVVWEIMSCLKHWNGSKEQTCCFKQSHCSCFSEIFLKLAKGIYYCLRLGCHWGITWAVLLLLKPVHQIRPFIVIGAVRNCRNGIPCCKFLRSSIVLFLICFSYENKRLVNRKTS